MTNETMPQTRAWLVEWESEGKTWTQAHASEVPARDQAARQNGRVTELCPTDQAETYATAMVREALEEAIDKVAFNGGSVEIEADIRALISKYVPE